MSLWQGKRQEARGKSEEGLGDFTFLYTVWFYCVHLLITSNEKTVIFEFRDEGNLFGNPYKNRVAIAFDIRDNQVCAYREYFGSDGESY